MHVLYHGDAAARLEAVADAVPEGATVLDVCCGPADLCRRLSAQSSCYIGIDINMRFLRDVRDAGGVALAADVRDLDRLPRCDVVTMVGSLYHFLPDASILVDRMVRHAGAIVILCEPVHNVTHSRRPLLRYAAPLLTNPGTEAPAQRFTAASFAALVRRAEASTVALRPVAGGRDMLAVLHR